MKEKKYLKRNTLITVFIIILLIGISSFIWKLFFIDQDIEKGTVQYNSPYQDVTSGNIVFPAYETSISMAKDQKKIPIVLINPKVNNKIVLKYKISITNNKKNKKIYESKFIKSGQALKYPTIDGNSFNELDKGKYSCKIEVYAYTYSINEYTNKKIKKKLNQAYWDIDFLIL